MQQSNNVGRQLFQKAMSSHTPSRPGTLDRRRIRKKVLKKMQDHHIPGAQLAVLRNGKVVFNEGLGVKKAGTTMLVDRHTIFEACSLTKPVFATAILKAIQEKILDDDFLDRPLVTLLPQEKFLARVNDFLESDETGITWQNCSPSFKRRFEMLTPRHLLTHTSGLPNWRQGPNIDFILEPESKWSYSGEGFELLGNFVSDITQKPLEQFIHDQIFEPFDMTQSAFCRKSGVTELTYATPHTSDEKTMPIKPFKRPNAAASMSSTASDYIKFIQGLSKSGLTDALLEAQVMTSENEPHCAWGLGFGLTESKNSFWHWGDGGPRNFKAFVSVNLDTGNGFVYFANSHNGLAIQPTLEQAFSSDTIHCHELDPFRVY